MTLSSSTRPNFTIVFFDLEMTGLSVTDQIIQIGAKCGHAEFNIHVLPNGKIPPAITRLTGISLKGTQMYHSGKAVEAVSPNTAANAFLDFLCGCGGRVILVAHNCFKSDGPSLAGLMSNEKMIPRFKATVIGFSDTLPLLKKLMPGRAGEKGYKLSDMAEEFLGSSDGAHDALGDAMMLEKLMLHGEIPITADHIIDSRQIVGAMTYKYKQRLDSYRTAQFILTGGSAGADLARNALPDMLIEVYRFHC